MHPPGAGTVLVRHGEVFTKSERVRPKMEGRLRDNVAALLADRGVPGDVEVGRLRPLVHTDPDHVDAAAAAAADAFGVVSASPALAVDPVLDDVTDALARAAEAHYDGGTFAVDARRSTDDLPFTSEDVGEAGGAAVWDAVADDFDPEVDLDDPDLTFGVEVRRSTAYVYLDTYEGPGGLPVGTQDPLVALVSGGIDSPVAAYEAMRRGAPVVPVYLDLGEYGGADHRARAVSSVRTLARHAPNVDLRVRVVPAGDVAADLAAELDRGRMLAFRRFMFRAAEHVARDVGARGIVSGEVVGQKSSQTTANLAVTSAATDLPVHRPLLARDKDDIVERARALGTFEDATVAAGCNRLAPPNPETRGRLSALRELEPDDLFDRAAAAARDATVVDADGTLAAD